jgi:hypothetical protein
MNSRSCSYYGIFRESERNWNSPSGGTVESKWGWRQSRYVFQHDIFFVPPNYGKVANFYRVKSEKVNVDTLAMKPHPDHPVIESLLSSNLIYTIELDNSLTFNMTKENVERRKIIDECRSHILTRKLPEIQDLSHIEFYGFCYHYAFGRVLSTYSICTDMPTPEIYGEKILEKYFTVTIEPQKGDLVVYYHLGSIMHWAIFLGNNMVESKWGSGSVYRHSLFDAPNNYGNTAKCFRLNDGLTIKSLAENLKLDNESMFKSY